MTEQVILRRVFSDIGAGKKFFVLGALFYIPVTILSVLQPLIIGYGAQWGMLGGSIERVTWVAVLFFAAAILLALFEYAQGLCLQIAGQKLVFNIRKRSFEKVQKLPMGFLDNTPVGKILTRLTNDAEAVAELFSMGAVQIIGDILFLAGTFIMLFFVNVSLSFYFILIIPMLAIGMYFFRVWTKKAFVQVRKVLSSLNIFLQEYISGITSVQFSNRLDKIKKEFDDHNKDYLLSNRQAVFLDAAIYSFIDVMSYIAVAVVLWGAFDLKTENILQLGVLVAFIEALSRFFQPLRELSNRFAVFQSAMVSLERMYEIANWPEEIDDRTKEPIKLKQEIRFENVSFAYKKSEPVIRNISFALKKFEHIALVGRTGAGKSTVIKLLNRFYQASSGKILIDNQDINNYSLGQVRKLISVVPQDVFLFHGTLEENLRFGNKNASDEKLWQALESVQIKNIVREKGGLSLMVASKGANFSLGERQLIAFARALISDPPILILDEATASVDSRTEKRLQYAIQELLKDRSALIIAHRLSTIKHVDKILVFQDGEIIEHGSHEELLAQDKIYTQMVEQASKNNFDKID